jgi:hypothetical protein
MTSDAGGYPVTFDVTREATQSRITNFPLLIGTLIRVILLIPHFIALFFLAIVAFILYFIATFAILFTGVYPESFYGFVRNYMRWYMRVLGYATHLYDKYPPFTGDVVAGYPLGFDSAYPATSSRLLNFPFLYYYIRAILMIPHLIIVYFLLLAMCIVIFIAQFAILFTGSFPEGMHRFSVGVSRWNARINAYLYGLTDKYPPFSTDGD